MLNIVIPMAGAGSRFAKAGYKAPKPLIEVCGKAMIEVVVDNLRPQQAHRFIFICQKEHVKKYGLQDRLTRLAPNCEIIQIDGVTEGAACTVLAASHLIDNDTPLMIANSDQYIDYSIDDYVATQSQKDLDGLIMTMTADDPKWSFVGFEENSCFVNRVVEKEVISNEATVGIYNFVKGSDFVNAAKAMIERDERVNGEFYVAPVYNELIKEESYKIGVVNIGSERSGMYGLGIPTDLDFFLTTEIARKLSGKVVQ